MRTELRLAYLCFLLHDRMKKGKGTKITLQRHFRLLALWEKEKCMNNLINSFDYSKVKFT